MRARTFAIPRGRSRVSAGARRRGGRPARGVGGDGRASIFAAGRSRRSPPRRASSAMRNPGSTLDLAVDIIDCDDDAVAYNGHARRRRSARDRARRLPRPDAARRANSMRRMRCASALRVLRGARRRAGPLSRRRRHRRPHRSPRAGHRAARAPRRARGSAVLRRSLPAPAGLPGDAAARYADAPRTRSRPRCGDGRRWAAAAAAPRDAREDALVHRAVAAARHRRRRSVPPERRRRQGDADREDRRQTGRERARSNSRMRGAPMSGRGAASRSPASASSRRSATTSRDVGRARRRCKAAPRRSRCFDASGFTTRIAAEVKDFDEQRDHRAAQVPEFRQSLASLRARRRRGSDARRRHRARRDDDAERWGCAVGTGMMGVDFADLAAVQRPLGARRRARPARTARPTIPPPTRAPSAAARARRGSRSSRAASAFAATRRRCTRPARPAGRRSAPR